jgi:hypothetical protein
MTKSSATTVSRVSKRSAVDYATYETMIEPLDQMEKSTNSVVALSLARKTSAIKTTRVCNGDKERRVTNGDGKKSIAQGRGGIQKRHLPCCLVSRLVQEYILNYSIREHYTRQKSKVHAHFDQQETLEDYYCHESVESIIQYMNTTHKKNKEYATTIDIIPSETHDQRRLHFKTNYSIMDLYQ